MHEQLEPEEIDLPQQLKLLEDNGTALIRRNQHEDAERVFRQIAEAAPRHVPALRYLASRALARGDLEEAQELLERALRIAPRSPMLHQNLGITLRARGYAKGALLAFDTTLRLNPALTMAWIQRGDVLQALGKRGEAIASYKRAEDLAGDLRALAYASREAPRSRRALRRAAILLARARESAVSKALASLREENSEAEFDRVIRAIRSMTKTIRPVYADPLQKPWFAYFPDLRARPFFENDEFPFLAALEGEIDAIRRELQDVLKEPNEFTPRISGPERREGEWGALDGSVKWSTYHLYRNGSQVESHCADCPRTLAAVQSLPLMHAQNGAPEVFFSTLGARTHIPPHHGPANYKLTVHVPLVIPSGCAIRVGDQTRTWKSKECLIFDDSFEHEAWNKSDDTHAVLVLEIWNPELSAIEKKAIQSALTAIDRFNRENRQMTTETVPTV